MRSGPVMVQVLEGECYCNQPSIDTEQPIPKKQTRAPFVPILRNPLTRTPSTGPTVRSLLRVKLPSFSRLQK